MKPWQTPYLNFVQGEVGEPSVLAEIHLFSSIHQPHVNEGCFTQPSQ